MILEETWDQNDVDEWLLYTVTRFDEFSSPKLRGMHKSIEASYDVINNLFCMPWDGLGDGDWKQKRGYLHLLKHKFVRELQDLLLRSSRVCATVNIQRYQISYMTITIQI